MDVLVVIKRYLGIVKLMMEFYYKNLKVVEFLMELHNRSPKIVRLMYRPHYIDSYICVSQ